MLINTICQHLSKRIENGELKNDELVQLIELIGSYLNLKTIAAYPKENRMSYNGVKNFRTITPIFGVKFVVENN